MSSIEICNKNQQFPFILNHLISTITHIKPIIQAWKDLKMKKKIEQNLMHLVMNMELLIIYSVTVGFCHFCLKTR